MMQVVDVAVRLRGWLLAIAFVSFGCTDEAGERIGAVRSDAGELVLLDVPAIQLVDGEGRPLLTSLRSPSFAGEVQYAGFGFSTAIEPELAVPSFETDDGLAPPPDERRHVATHVVSVEETAEGSTMVLATDDPAGRTMNVAVASGPSETFDLTITLSDSADVTSVHVGFSTAPDEAFHGFGGRREATELRGHSIDNWIFDYRYPDVSTAYYYPQPMFLSSQGYALWLRTESMARFRMASDRDDAFRISVREPSMRIVLAAGTEAEPLRQITTLTGRHRVAPEWSMAPTISRTIQIIDNGPGEYEARVVADVERLLADAGPIGAYAYEGWAQLPLEFVEQTNAELREAGIHPILYLRSFVSNDVAGTEPPGRFDEAIAAGYVATTAEGEPYVFPGPFADASAAIVDFTNPAARTWWKSLVKQMLELGADGFMNDFGEQVLEDMHFADGSTGATMHNRYPVLQHEAAREAIDEFEAEHPEREIYVFVRAGYPGSAAHENATFPGDETTDWDRQTGLPSIVPDMLNRAIFGAYGFSTDIGGYADFVSPPPDAELFLRWTQAAVFTTHVRVHNTAFGGVRMPWSYDAATEASWNAMAELHLAAVPLMRALWAEALDTGMPPIRPLYLVDPQARESRHVDDQWMVGNDLVVAPVLEQGAVEREVWLPEGCWRMHGDGVELEGRREHVVPAPLEVLPWFVRCGTDPLAD